MPDPLRALIIRIGALGDLLLTRRLTYSLSLSGFRSTLFAPARHAALLQADPWIEEVLDSESSRYGSAFWGAWPHPAKGAQEIGHFELAVVISRSADLRKFAAGRSAGVIQIPPESAKEGRSIALQWAERASDAATPFEGPLPLFPTDSSLVRVPGATVIHPGSGSPEKNWPVDRFVALGERLQSAGHRVTWLRGPAEGAPPPAAAGFTDLADLSLRSLAATLSASRLFIGNDSGVSHLAAAVGASTFALFGPTDPAVWRPDGLRVVTLRAPSKQMTSLEVGAVVSCLSSHPDRYFA